MPLVSIIVPVYNSERYVERCINSLISQTLTDIEIIVINDGSKDDSDIICTQLEKKDKRIHYYLQENMGVSVARNKGLSMATGEWITFVDSDDWVEPTMCECAYNAVSCSNADIVMWGYWLDSNQKSKKQHFIKLCSGDVTSSKALIQTKIISRYADGDICENAISAGATWGKLCRRELIEKYKLQFVEGLTRAQDTVFWLHAFEHANTIYYLDECLNHYSISEDSICSGKKYISRCEVPFEKLMDEYEKFISEYHDQDERFMRALFQRGVQILDWYMKHKILNKENPAKIIKKRNMIYKLISTSRYKKVLKNVKTDILPKSLKLYIFLLRKKMIFTYILAYRVYEKLQIRGNGGK